jgi:hypothetical protein
LSTRVKIEGDPIRKIDGRTASWNKARTTAFSRAGQRECRPLTRLGDRSSEQRAAGGRHRCDASATRPPAPGDGVATRDDHPSSVGRVGGPTKRRPSGAAMAEAAAATRRPRGAEEGAVLDVAGTMPMLRPPSAPLRQRHP